MSSMHRNNLGPAAQRTVEAARRLREQHLRRNSSTVGDFHWHQPGDPRLLSPGTGPVEGPPLPSLGAIIQNRLESREDPVLPASRVGGRRLSSTVGNIKPASQPRRTVGQFYEERQRKTTGQFYETRQLQEVQTTGQDYAEADSELINFVSQLRVALQESGLSHRVDPSNAFVVVDVDGEEVQIHPYRDWTSDQLKVVVDSGPGTQPAEIDADPVRVVSFLSQDVNLPFDESFGVRRSGEPSFEEYEGAYSPLNVGAPKAANPRAIAGKIAENIASELSSHQGLYGKRVSGVSLRGNHVHFSCDNNKVKATVAVTPEKLVKVTLSGPKLSSSAAVITDIAHAEPQKIAEKIVGRVCQTEQLRPTVGSSPLVNKSIPNMPTIGRTAAANAPVHIEPDALELALFHAQDIKGDDSLRKYVLEIISLGRDGVSKIYVDKKKEALFHTQWDRDPTKVISLDEELFSWLAEWARDICAKDSDITDLVDAAWYRAGDAQAAAQPLHIKDFASLVDLSKKLPPKEKGKKGSKKATKKKPVRKAAKKKSPKKAPKKAPAKSKKKSPAKRGAKKRVAAKKSTKKAVKGKTTKRKTAKRKTTKRKTTTRGRKS